MQKAAKREKSVVIRKKGQWEQHDLNARVTERLEEAMEEIARGLVTDAWLEKAKEAI